MGCLCSRGQTQDSTTHRTFKVINVDDHGQERNPGRIEITESELIWYQRNKEPVRWPLNSLRRYGFDAELFSFECGRRCPTGPGIYAFKCRQAEALFNLLQESVQRQRTGQDDMIPVATPNLNTANLPAAQPHVHADHHSSSNGNAVLIGATHSAPQVAHDALEPDGDGSPLYVNEEVNAHEYINTNIVPQHGTSRQNSVVNPSGVSLAVPPAALDNDHVIQYAELDLPTAGDNGSMNDLTPVHVPNGHGPAGDVQLLTSSQQAMYVNVPASEIKAKTASLGPLTSAKTSGPGPRNGLTRQFSKTEEPPRISANGQKAAGGSTDGITGGATGGPRMNYAQLDLGSNSESLGNGSNQSPASPLSSSNPESPKTDTYAMIDIERTQALNNRLKNTDDEGSRKTRHNSNIDELLQ